MYTNTDAYIATFYILLLSYINKFIHIYIQTNIDACLLTFLPTNLPNSLTACLYACIQTYISTELHMNNGTFIGLYVCWVLLKQKLLLKMPQLCLVTPKKKI